ncbi:E3 ubiquitin-protein ligase TRIM39-like isoform X2 [Acipenser ruthenus]|nr:E3 ubiquitin-protein ligase TRIM39-like isoform X2 [Acipenser ruthenus]XP_058872800.1 E3 ubiquitin-protein ligase TRIM39-like isoform X2 [Acipenser ruthenus]
MEFLKRLIRVLKIIVGSLMSPRTIHDCLISKAMAFLKKIIGVPKIIVGMFFKISTKILLRVPFMSNFVCAGTTEREKEIEELKQECVELKQDCDEIRKKFNAVGYVVERKWSSIVKDQAKVTLNPDTANPSLAVSPDGSQVRFKGEGSAEWPSVLSREGFTSGRHYWEVEVGEKGYWALGISKYLDEKIIPEKPEMGYWLLRRWKGNMYEAVSQSLVPLTLQHKLYKVGMILDYQKGELSFYNVYDGSTRYEIHTFNYKFTEVYPVFSPGSHDRGPLKITRFKSGDGNPKRQLY